MYPVVIKSVVTAVTPLVLAEIPNAVNQAYEGIVSWFKEDEVVKAEPIKKRKKYDNSKITKEQYDVLMEMYSNYRGIITQDELTQNTNEILGLNKSRTSYGNYWLGKKSRDDCQ